MIQGHSGCEITICEGLLKKSNGAEYPAERLREQIKKQKRLSESYIHKNIIIPRILKEEEDSYYTAFMEYFPCSNIIQYLHIASKEDLDNLIENIFHFINHGVEQSKIEKIDPQLIVSKFESISGAESFRRSLDKYLYDEINLPVGFCHGDLTLSNILFNPNSNQIVFIDFLDSFIESPIVDIAKIRQDTRHLWSSFIYKQKHDKIKIKLSLDYLDKKFVEGFEKLPFYRHYKLFQFINLLRILPYAKNKETTNFIRKEICSI